MNITAEFTPENTPKPLDRMLEQAACKYYEVTIDFFKVKKKDGQTDRRRALFWLLYNDAAMDYRVIASRYGYSHTSICEGVKTLDFRKTVVNTIARDIENIRKIALGL